MESLQAMLKHSILIFLFVIAGMSEAVALANPEQAVMNRFRVPEFVLTVPRDHFAGVSSPTRSLQMARKSAIRDVTRQVLSSIEATFDHRYTDRIYGNLYGNDLKRVVNDRLSGVAQGIVIGIEQNIVQSSWVRDDGGLYIYFVLVHYPERFISEMRRLSKGAKVLVSISESDDEQILLKVAEVNGVSVVISSINVRLKKTNRFSKAISFFVWHVPEGSEKVVTASIDPVKICHNSATIRFSVNGYEKSLFDYLLGAKLERIAVLKGHDELGRDVKTIVPF